MEDMTTSRLRKESLRRLATTVEVVVVEGKEKSLLVARVIFISRDSRTVAFTFEIHLVIIVISSSAGENATASGVKSRVVHVLG
jgi:hypothetical protein